MNRILAVSAAAAGLVGALTLSACGSSGSSAGTDNSSAPGSGSASSGSDCTPSTAALPTSPGSVTMGSAAFPENVLLANIYGGAMKAKGVKVSYKTNIGERSVYFTALQDGGIGAVPEYNGSILAYLDKSATQKTTSAVDSALAKQLSCDKLVATTSSPAEDKDTITVTKDTQSKYKLTSIGDLKPVASQLTLGGPAQFKTRADGVPALKSVYGVVFGRFVPTSAGGTATVDALKNGGIDAADIFSTDPAIVKNNFVSLTDPKNMFAAQNITPIFSQKVLTQPMKDACDAVSAKLSTSTLLQLVSEVGNGKSESSVAQAWLKQNNLA